VEELISTVPRWCFCAFVLSFFSARRLAPPRFFVRFRCGGSPPFLRPPPRPAAWSAWYLDDGHLFGPIDALAAAFEVILHTIQELDLGLELPREVLHYQGGHSERFIFILYRTFRFFSLPLSRIFWFEAKPTFTKKLTSPKNPIFSFNPVGFSNLLIKRRLGKKHTHNAF